MIDDLYNKKKFHDLINLQDLNKKQLIKMLKTMLMIRKVENKIASERKRGLIGGPVHLSVGQEAIATGISQNLKKTDKVFGGHRSHAHLLALNSNFYKLFSEVLGKTTGFSKGMGGSMHLYDESSGFFGATPIVAGTVSLAVGAALASKMKKLNDIGVSYFGDGAIEEGVVHECFNLAKVFKLPVLFVVENNLFASHMHILQRQPSKEIFRFAVANKINHRLLDGNDVVTVFKKSKEIIDNMRKDKEPVLLELVTYRWYGHVDWREDVDVGVNRTMEDIKDWKERDPIIRLSHSMIKSKIWSKNQQEHLECELDNEIQKAWKKAISDPYPSEDAIMKFVYSS